MREEALERARAKLGFLRQLAAYAIVNVALLAMDLLTSPGQYWFFWPLLGWGAEWRLTG